MIECDDCNPHGVNDPILGICDSTMIVTAVARLDLVRYRIHGLTRRNIMKIFAIGLAAKPLTDEQKQQIMPREVPHTLKLYLDGKIEQFWFRNDHPGVVFLMNAESVEEVKATVSAMPLASGGFLGFEYIPVGPLMP